MPTITHWKSLTNAAGREEAVTWDELFSRFSKRPDSFDVKTHPGWSAAVFVPCERALANVRSVSAVCLDFDKGEAMDVVVERLAGLYGFVHTTRRHTAEVPRFRVILPLARNVSKFEYPELWKRVAHAAGSVDEQPKDAGRFWFTPGAPAESPFETRRLDGEPLDPDEWLEKPDPTPAPVREYSAPTKLVDPSATERRAIAYLSKMDPGIQGSGGSTATYKAACALVKGFCMLEGPAFRMLRDYYNPRCVPPWSDVELTHKVKQASKARLQPGYILGAQQEHQPGRAPHDDLNYVPEPPDWFDEVTGEVADAEPLREPGDDTDEEPHVPAPPAQPTAMDTFGATSLKAMYLGVLKEVERGAHEKGFTTGVLPLDIALGGLRRGNITLLAAQTSWGKSSFGVMVTAENLRTARPLVISVEDKELMYARRMVSREQGINAMCLRDNDLDQTAMRKLTAAVENAPTDPIFIDAVGKSVEWVARAIVALSKEYGINLVICDYVQRFKADKNISDRRNQVTYIGETLSDAIKNANAAGLVLSQLKRVEGREPAMDDVKESGDLENMAEHVMIGWRKVEAVDPRTGESVVTRKVNIPKNKDGPIVSAWLDLRFDELTASFQTMTGVLDAERHSLGYDQFDDVGGP